MQHRGEVVVLMLEKTMKELLMLILLYIESNFTNIVSETFIYGQLRRPSSQRALKSLRRFDSFISLNHLSCRFHSDQLHFNSCRHSKTLQNLRPNSLYNSLCEHFSSQIVQSVAHSSIWDISRHFSLAKCRNA
uniref:Uncharacterized protein n=1 Tax=Parascaris univalens TaxID=6257 RepID=A0A915AWK3_PARUN